MYLEIEVGMDALEAQITTIIQEQLYITELLPPSRGIVPQCIQVFPSSSQDNDVAAILIPFSQVREVSLI